MIHPDLNPDKTRSVKGNKHDYHHIKNYNDVDEGNWIAYLRTQDRVKSYTWITNEHAIDDLDDNNLKYISTLKDYT